MKYVQIRQAFKDYFKNKGHQDVESSSLIPHNDPTLMFTNAGMNQFKDAFVGEDKRSYDKAVTIQKCLRAGGKHNDLENVGFTARHHTFFEMMGNFSFGDYFKKEAIAFAWEFLTKTLGIPEERLYVTVFETDDEAAEIWHNQEGVPKEKIFRYGEKDNFWRMGQTGPCGPCSEIFYDHNPDGPKIPLHEDEDRFVEIWNLVFMQFYEDESGKQTPLPKPSVDTGAGIERIAAAMQGFNDNYQSDVFWPLIQKTCQLSGISEDWESLNKTPELIGAVKVVADHARAAAFLISEGVLPSNEGRGYVLRRIMRRAIRYARKLSQRKSIYPLVVEEVLKTMAEHYPGLEEKSELILKAAFDEEKRFLQTLDKGSEII
ncbi:MAG: alanine--tRNA ligase, partial [Bdellovibrionales bacterium]|nr:alanine--tRNA ligase [Bdellovibrionales bacterium]